MGKLAFKHSKGLTEIVTSPFCPIGQTYLLDERTWSLHYLGESGDDFVDFARNGTDGILVQAHDGAGVEIRVESYGNLVCNGPGKNARLYLSNGLLDLIDDA